MPSIANRPLLVKAYFVFAWAAGIMAAILVFVGFPLQYWAHENQVAEIVGVIHGVGVYPAYMLLSITMAFKYRLSIPHMALMVLAGLCPGLGIYVSMRTLKHIDAKEEARLARLAKKQQKKKLPAQAKKPASSVNS